MPRVTIKFIMLSAVMLNIVMLNVIILSDVMLVSVILSVVASLRAFRFDIYGGLTQGEGSEQLTSLYQQV
jgi:hypothetical protein